VVHHYGNTVCHTGNCWSGGGDYYGTRGDINKDLGPDTSHIAAALTEYNQHQAGNWWGPEK
jgi:hypothetical protein